MSKQKEKFKRILSGEFEPWLKDAYTYGYVQAIKRAANPELHIGVETIEADFRRYLKHIAERD